MERDADEVLEHWGSIIIVYDLSDRRQELSNPGRSYAVRTFALSENMASPAFTSQRAILGAQYVVEVLCRKGVGW